MGLTWLYYLINGLYQADCIVHTAKRCKAVVKYSGLLGLAAIEFGKQKVDVIWPPQTAPDYIEEIIKLNENQYSLTKKID